MMSSSRYQFVFLSALIAIGAIIGVTDAKPPSRISGASDAPPGVFTWMVSIGIMRGKFGPAHICGGAIISSRHILTAGHCVGDKNAKNLKIRGGITNLRDTNAVSANVAKITLHPDYVSQILGLREIDNDIAILTLDKDLNLDGRLTEVAIPNSMPKNHQIGSVAGWGNIKEDPVTVGTLTLKTDDVEYLDATACSRWMKPVEPQFFCGLQENGNILSGDSGSPLVSEGAVIGVVSSGWGYVRVPDSYTNVYHYRDWINSVIDH